MVDETAAVEKTKRLHYLDWLQVIAILGVFLFHAVHPFDDLFAWHIKNDQPSLLVNFFVGFFGSFGMPFFFCMAGATSWFSLRRRSAGLYARDRVTRLLIPYIVGAIFLTPIQAYFEVTHKGWWKADSFLSFLFSPDARRFFFTEVRPLELGPTLFGRLGYHLWFVGFLFAFSLVALPIFLWLKKEGGRRVVGALARLANWRGGLLVFIIPLFLARIVLHRYFPDEHNWSDFLFLLTFFVLGYVIISDERFTNAIRRDWPLHLILGVASTLFFFSSAAGVPLWEWLESPGTIEFYLSYLAIALNAWCWTMFIFYIGMRYLNSSSDRLRYAREASYPFFFLHQPVIIFIAFFVVEWGIPLTLKLLIVVIGSFLLSLGIYDLFVRRINPVRALFGLKPKGT
jgi:peptidoglycan/LPS O-acetylase OafA/YrhL